MPEITHYYVHVGHGTQTKNNLQKDFGSYLRSLEGTLIDKAKLKSFKAAIINHSNMLNAINRRCTLLKISFSDKYSKNGFMITGFDFLSFQLLEAHYESY